MQAKQSSELKAVCELAEVIWREHYTPIIGAEQVEYMLDKYQSYQAVSEQIEQGIEYYQIVSQQKLVGYLSFKIESQAIFLSKIYVDKSQRGLGAGRAGLDFIKDKALSLALPKVRLTVNKYNSNTIAVYEKMGFKKVDSVVMDIGSGYVMDDYIMELELL